MFHSVGRILRWAKDVYKRQECTVMPLMVSATETAEELSAAAVTRGIENPARKTSAVSLRMPAADCIGMLAVFILLVLSYVVQ